jgi:hypothetical protein
MFIIVQSEEDKGHSYKLHVFDYVKHVGEVDWRQFRDSMMSELPHQWRSREDTTFHLAHFEKKRQSGGGTLKSSVWNSEGTDTMCLT